MNDKQVMSNFVIVLGVLVFIAIGIYIIAKVVTPNNSDRDDPLLRGAVLERIQPIGNVNTGGVPVATAVAPAAAALKTASGDVVYNAVCAGCHTAGVAGAPKYGDQGAWVERLAQGADALYGSAINGKGVMPAKGGGADYSDDSIKAAVDYMVNAVQ